jgi:hypothetical protein
MLVSFMSSAQRALELRHEGVCPPEGAPIAPYRGNEYFSSQQYLVGQTGPLQMSL